MKFALATVLLAVTVSGVLSRYVSVSLNLAMTVSDDRNPLSEEIIRICMRETEISMMELEQFKRNEIRDNESNESLQCFAHCVYEQIGVMRDGIFVENDIFRNVSSIAELNNNIPKQCQNIQGSNKCETAYKIHSCYTQHKHLSAASPQEQSDFEDNQNIPEMEGTI